MRRFKETDVEWIGKIPQDWEVKPIKQVYRFQTGWTPATSDESNFEGDNIWVNISDMKQRIIYDSAKHISDKAVAISSMNISPKGSLLYAFKLSVGAVAFCGKDLYTNEAIATFLPCENSLEYLFYAAPIFIIENANENIYGAKLLNQQLINNAKIVVPPIGEQQRIADYLDSKCSKIDSIIEKQQAVIEKLKEYKLSVITEAVTKGLNPDVEMKDSGVEWIGDINSEYAITRVGALCFVTKLAGFEYTDTMVNAIKTEGDVPIVRAQNVRMFEFNDNINEFIDFETSSKLDRCALNKKSVLITFIGAGIGEVCVLDQKKRYHLAPNVAKIEIRKEYSDLLSEKYLMYYLGSNAGKGEISKISKASAQPSLSMGTIRGIQIVLPSKDEQYFITEFLDKKCKSIDVLIESKSKFIDKLHEYKKALIYEVVTGKKEV